MTSQAFFLRSLAVAFVAAFLSPAAEGRPLDGKYGVPAVFVFGDSTTDAGNNNYIANPIYSANMLPNGQDFIPASGRFTNGKLIVDYLCDYLDLPAIPPFLQPGANLKNGINFASGGAGVLNATRAGRTIPFEVQQDNFNKVYNNPSAYGLTSETIQNALFYISISANDYIVYITELQSVVSFEDYKMQVVGNITKAIKNLYAKGVRKFVVQGIPALGCAPAISLAFNAKPTGSCNPFVQGIMESHNAALKPALAQLLATLPEIRLSFSLAFFQIQLEAAEDPKQYGFKVGLDACCGVGPYGGAVACGQCDVIDGQNVTTSTCSKPDNYAFWDYFHPSSEAYRIMAAAMWKGKASLITPYSVKDLVKGKD